MNDIEIPFYRKCESYKNGETIKNEFYYDTMINCDRTYYYLKNKVDNNKYISTFVVNKIIDQCDKYISKFDGMDNIEKYAIDQLGVSGKDNKNVGIMTVMFCDIVLTIIAREFAFKYNVVIQLRDMSKIEGPEKEVNVYRSVLPNYRKDKTNPNDKRIELKGDSQKEIFYLFSLETRENDISYYENLKMKKLKEINEYLQNNVEE